MLVAMHATDAAAQGAPSIDFRTWLVGWGLAQPEVPKPADVAPESAGSWHEKTSTELEPSQESWMGFDGYRRVASMYSGVTWSPVGNLRQDGFRVRLIGGESVYRYGGNRYDEALDKSVPVAFFGRAQFVDVMAGWQFSAGSATVKVFGGWAWANNRIAPFDPATRIQGIARGPKAAVEVWQNWSPKLWTSVDLSASRVHGMYAVQTRTGWRIDGTWSAGPEFAVTGHAEATLQRAGLFVRYDDSVDEVTISGGVSRARGDLTNSAYGTAQFLHRY
jgi:Cellulose biosynthesis protein BcsS